MLSSNVLVNRYEVPPNTEEEESTVSQAYKLAENVCGEETGADQIYERPVYKFDQDCAKLRNETDLEALYHHD